MTDPSTPPPAEPGVGSPIGASTSGSPVATDFRVGIGSISDVVFGLALSIGSLILVAKTPQNGDALVHGVYYFGFSFLIVILAWFSYRRIVVVLPYETVPTVIVTVGLLFCVAIEPFLFYVLVTTGTIGDDASMAFAIDIGVMMFLLSALTYLLLREERSNSTRKLSRELRGRQARSILLHLAVGSIYLVSALPVFWTLTLLGGPARELLWYFALGWVFALQARMYSTPRAHPGPGTSAPVAVASAGVPAEAR